MASRTYKLNFVGDVMLGRLIDQLLPAHVNDPANAEAARSLSDNDAALHKYGPSSPWGNTLSLFHEADLNLINLETSITTHPTPWPDKTFNYRAHPSNFEVLKAAKISYAGLANNHTLDFGVQGISETVKSVKEAGIACAGAGESREEALNPAVLRLQTRGGGAAPSVSVWAASDHPSDWSEVSTFNWIDYSTETRARIKKTIQTTTASDASLKIFSIHWGPNYSWRPSKDIKDFAHFLVDQCGIDIVHGHSSHHVQGVEHYKGKLIIYGCGDFIDDYALVPEYRNDLGAVWRVVVEEDTSTGGLKVKHLEIFPTRCERFQAQKLHPSDPDFGWVASKVLTLSGDYGGFALETVPNESHIRFVLV